MFRGNLRQTIVILIIGIAAVTSIIFPTIEFNLGGIGFERGSSGPLGLRLGLDLQGGVHLVYQADVDDPTKDQMTGALQIIERRVNAFGVTEPSLQLMDRNRILIQLPGVDDIEEAKRLIGQTAVLEFKERVCTNESCSDYEDRDIGLTGKQLTSAYPDRHTTTGSPIVSLVFNAQGTSVFAETTGRIAGTGDRIAIFLDGQELLAPVAQEAILGGRAIIQGADFTTQRVRTMAIQLESGRLPVPISIIEEHDVDATLGKDALERSLLGGYIGFGLVALFMFLYYRIPGVLATLALLFYIAVVLAIFKLIPVTLTLAGIAGFILSIGMAVDANILIFERMKEELRSGRNLISSIEIGFSRAWSAIRDSNISTFITCLILFWFGSRLGASLVTGFAVTLFIGVAVSMFSAIFVSKTFLRLSASTPIGRRSSLFTPVPNLPSNATSNVHRRRS